MKAREERIYPTMHPPRVLELEFLEPLEMTPTGWPNLSGAAAGIRHRAWQAGHQRRYGFEAGTLLWD
jgi:hypothetical protein